MSEDNIVSNNENLNLRTDNVTSISQASISKPKQKKVISVSSTSQSSIPKNHKHNVNLTDLTKAKISDLLYEITERAIQLAQPRSCKTETEVSQKPLKCRISKPTSRIIELACPKMIHNLPTKPINFVSPNALKAIASQRIIELSQPRKNQHFKSLTCKTRMYQPCSSKIRSWSEKANLNTKTKQFSLSGKSKSEMTRLLQGLLRSISENDRDAKSMRKRLEQGNKSEMSKKKKKQEPRYLISTNSDRSIVIINLD